MRESRKDGAQLGDIFSRKNGLFERCFGSDAASPFGIQRFWDAASSKHSLFLDGPSGENSKLCMDRFRAVSCSQDSTCRTTTGTISMRTVRFGLQSSRLQGFGRWRSGNLVEVELQVRVTCWVASCFAVPVT